MVQSKKKTKTEAVRSAAPPKKKDEDQKVGKVEELRKNKKVDNDFALELEDASDDDWDKPKGSKKDAKPASDYEEDWDMDDKDLGLEDKNDHKKTEKAEVKSSAPPK